MPAAVNVISMTNDTINRQGKANFKNKNPYLPHSKCFLHTLFFLTAPFNFSLLGKKEPYLNKQKSTCLEI